MDNKNNTENNEYQFVREKIASRKKSRVKKVLLITVGTVALAILFGFLARLTFGLSENVVSRILGLSPTPTHSPYKMPTSTSAPSLSPTPVPPTIQTPEPSPTSTPEPATPTPRTDEWPTSTPTPTVTATPDAEENGLSYLIDIYKQLRDVARKASAFMAEIKLVKITTDWFGEPLETSTSTSGIILGDNGSELLLLVNSETAESADRLDAVIGGEVVRNVRIKAFDDEYNLAVLSAELSKISTDAKSKIAYAGFEVGNKPAQGTPLIAVGCPNGVIGSFETGMITTDGEYVYVTDNKLEIMNTDIPYRENGNGVFVDFNGKIVGIITHKFREGNNGGMMSMVTISNMHSVIENLANGREGNYLGVVAKEAPESLLAGLSLKNGLYITEVKSGSPAEKAGIRKGDILTVMGKDVLDTVETLYECLNRYEPGDEVNLQLVRDAGSILVRAIVQKNDRNENLK